LLPRARHHSLLYKRSKDQQIVVCRILFDPYSYHHCVHPIILGVIPLTMKAKPSLPAKQIFNGRGHVPMTNGVDLRVDSAVQDLGLIVTSKRFVPNVLILCCIIHLLANIPILSPGFWPDETD
jgi:hypothetical protein